MIEVEYEPLDRSDRPHVPGEGIEAAQWSWADRAACLGMELNDFFSEGSIALAVCDRCPVLAPCLTAALSDPGTVGVWGGTTDSDRVALRRADRGVRP